MPEWNILVTAQRGREDDAFRFLKHRGRFIHTGFKDVLLGFVEDTALFLDQLEFVRRENPRRINSLSQVVPMERSFHFELSDLIDKLKEAVLLFAERVGEKRFYVRAIRRGHKGELSSDAIEREVAGFLVATLEKTGIEVHVGFSDPDAIVVIETIANWAGAALVTREMREKYPLIKVK
jgi:tRNA(Ser,Leu) C12 N-acetylase TAN1